MPINENYHAKAPSIIKLIEMKQKIKQRIDEKLNRDFSPICRDFSMGFGCFGGHRKVMSLRSCLEFDTIRDKMQQA